MTHAPYRHMTRAEAVALVDAIERLPETWMVPAMLISYSGQGASSAEPTRRAYSVQLRNGGFSGAQVTALEQVAKDHGAEVKVAANHQKPDYLNEVTVLRFYMLVDP